jgi:hypothetical protein
MQFDSNPKTSATNLLSLQTAERFEHLQEVGSQICRAFNQVFFHQGTQRGASHRTT